ncbi:MAG: branched-chain amino acid ABC transporter permease [Thermodesulfobacteriota bacterium]
MPTLAGFIQTFCNGIFQGGVYALMALGLAIIFGVMHIINFAHGEFLLIGAYLAYWLFRLLHLDPFLSLPITFAVVFIFGHVTQKYLLDPVRKDHFFVLVMTYSLSILMVGLMFISFKSELRSVVTSYSLYSLDFMDANVILNIQDLAILVLAGLFFILIHLFMNRTWLGKCMSVCAQDEEAAQLMGIDPRRISCWAFGLGAALTAVTGALMVTSQVFNPGLGGVQTLKAFTIVILGGMGNIWGTMLGGLIIGLIESVATLFMPAMYKPIIGFIILLLVLLLRPSGLLGKKAG